MLLRISLMEILKDIDSKFYEDEDEETIEESNLKNFFNSLVDL